MGSTILFFNDTATTEIYTLSLHDALPIWPAPPWWSTCGRRSREDLRLRRRRHRRPPRGPLGEGRRRAVRGGTRSEEHTSELQSRQYLVCRLLLEKKKKTEPTSGSICRHVQ